MKSWIKERNLLQGVEVKRQLELTIDQHYARFLRHPVISGLQIKPTAADFQLLHPETQRAHIATLGLLHEKAWNEARTGRKMTVETIKGRDAFGFNTARFAVSWGDPIEGI